MDYTLTNMDTKELIYITKEQRDILDTLVGRIDFKNASVYHLNGKKYRLDIVRNT